jgi:hypothetical protein
MISTPKAVPVLRWHHLQWQMVTHSGTPMALNRTALQTHRPEYSMVILAPHCVRESNFEVEALAQIGIHRPWQ